MLQRIDIYTNEVEEERIFGLTMGNYLTDEEVVEFHENVKPLLVDFKTKKFGKTSKNLIEEKQIFLISKENYIFCLLTDPDDKIKEFDSIIESLFTMLVIRNSENKKEIDFDLKRTISDALNAKLGSKKKEKSLLKPLSVYRKKSKEQRTKFFLIGLGKVGKSSIYYQFFENWTIEKLEKITATIGISQKKVDDVITQEKLLINDLGGQAQFRDQYLADPTYFHGAAGMIFIVDCHEIDQIVTTEEYFSKIIDQIENDPAPHRPLIAIFIHKYDPNKRKELENNIFEHWMPMLERSFRKYNPPFFLTSIYDNTATESMARFFLQSMPSYLLSNVINSEMVLQAVKSLYPILNQLDPLIDDNINTEVVETDLYDSAQKFGIESAKKITKQWQEYLLQEEAFEQPESDSLELDVEQTGHFEVRLHCPIPVSERRSELCAITHGLFSGLGKSFGYFHVDMIETEIRDNSSICKFSISD
jgi:GTPase SAR1 family protein